MLVLSRKAKEAIVFPGSDVRITVLAVQGTRVRLGIEAPPNEPVYRSELWARNVINGVPDECIPIKV